MYTNITINALTLELSVILHILYHYFNFEIVWPETSIWQKRCRILCPFQFYSTVEYGPVNWLIAARVLSKRYNKIVYDPRTPPKNPITFFLSSLWNWYGKVFIRVKWPIKTCAYLGFLSIKRLEVFVLPELGSNSDRSIRSPAH